MGWKRITCAAATTGAAEGTTLLTAFDCALLAAGIGNINLSKISSILPPATTLGGLPRIKPGAIVPTAYAAECSEVPGNLIAACVGWARTRDPEKNGVIMEFHGSASRDHAEAVVAHMLEEAFAARGWEIAELRVHGVEHRVGRVGCAVAAIVLLSYDDLC